MLTQRFFSALFFILILQSCGGGISQEEHDKTVLENESFKKEIEDLKREIEDLKFGADKLLNEAKKLFTNKQYDQTKWKSNILIDKHPTSEEAVEAKKLIEKAEKEIEKEERLAEKKARAKEEANKKRLARATSKMRKNTDEMKEITWYRDRNTTRYNNVNSFHLYMGKKENGSPWLRLRIQYKGDDWLFIDNYNIKTDNDTYDVRPTERIERDNGVGGIWEWYDESLNSRTYSMIQDIITSKSVKIRHNGKQYYRDRRISSREKSALKNVLDAYEALGGNLNF